MVEKTAPTDQDYNIDPDGVIQTVTHISGPNLDGASVQFKIAGVNVGHAENMNSNAPDKKSGDIQHGNNSLKNIQLQMQIPTSERDGSVHLELDFDTAESKGNHFDGMIAQWPLA